MELGPITLDRGQVLCELRPQRNAILRDFAPRQSDNLGDCFVDLQVLSPRRRFVDERADTMDDIRGSIPVPHHAIERLPQVMDVKRFGAQAAQSDLRIGDGPGDWCDCRRVSLEIEIGTDRGYWRCPEDQRIAFGTDEASFQS